MLPPRTVLVLTVVGIVPAFAGVNALVSAARGRRQQLATEWAERGARDLAAGRAADAADEFRAAQEYARDPTQYRLRLARALLNAGHIVEARSQLLTLWSETPGNGLINMELARLAAKDEDLAAATRYYHGAIDGAWDTDAPHQRREARIELARLLVERGNRTQAQAELIALSADPPVDPRIKSEMSALRIATGLDTLPSRAVPIDLQIRASPEPRASRRR